MSTPTDDLALLVLEDGTVHRGRAYGARGRTLGEAVFTTGMTGYQETLTDPSYAGQIIVQTSPHIGNTGVNDADRESRAIFAAGYVVRDAARRPSNWRAERSLDEELEAFGVVGIREVEAQVQESLHRIMQGKTVLAIAHRLSTIAEMDRIVVMDAGRIVEQGSHAQLLAQGGLYARYWNRQSGGFLGTEPEEAQAAE